MDVCGSCGVVVPKRGLPCGVCGASSWVEAPARGGTLYFVQATCQFQCRGCARLAPLDTVDVDGTVRCVLCGLKQAFDPGAWKEALAWAHGLGDLAGGEGLHPSDTWAIGTDNPHADVGRTAATDVLTVGGTGSVGGVQVSRSLRMQAGPGHPLCLACKAPLDVSVEAEGRVRARCRECGAASVYEVPAAVLGACRGLRGVIAEVSRAELREAKTGAGVSTLSCPGCGAPLPARGRGRVIECQFCHATCKLPAEDAGTVEDAEPTPIWLVYGGASAARRALESGAGGEASIPEPKAEVLTGSRWWLSQVPPAIIAGGLTLVTGVVLFVLMRMGLIWFPKL